jgi:hypothetical protein
MARATLILRKAAGYASSKMVMDVSGRGLVEIFKSIMLHHTKRS